jgi:hypothetical protein
MKACHAIRECLLKLMMGFGGGVPEVRNASDGVYAVAIEEIFFKEHAAPRAPSLAKRSCGSRVKEVLDVRSVEHPA